MIDKCTRCAAPATKRRGMRRLCLRHYRIDCMRECAKSKGKVVPSPVLLELLLDDLIAGGMKCPHCRQSVVLAGNKGQANVISLQHDRSGVMRLLCLLCNNRHQAFPGDSFYDYQLDWKYCAKCSTAKHETEFYLNRTTGRRKSYCKACKHQIARSEYARLKNASH
jgi:hypothetical protein